VPTNRDASSEPAVRSPMTNTTQAPATSAPVTRAAHQDSRMSARTVSNNAGSSQTAAKLARPGTTSVTANVSGTAVPAAATVRSSMIRSWLIGVVAAIGRSGSVPS
jgi:hypothetical protein